jgi:hypothetical protein
MADSIITTANAQRWQAALNRAIAEAVDILVEPISGEVFCESSTRPGTLYVVSRTSCTCKAGQQGVPCKHRASLLAQLGELPLNPDPDPGVTFNGTSDRVEVLVAGRHYGDAVATEPDPAGVELVRESSDRVAIHVDGQQFGFAVMDEHGGWIAFRGFFPNACRFPQADGYTLEVVERQLAAMRPARLPLPAVTSETALAVA